MLLLISLFVLYLIIEALVSTLIAGLMIIMVTLVILQHLIITPIIDIRKYVRSIRESGNFSRRINSPRRDEIGQLAREFDRLMAQLYQQNRILAETNKLYEKEISIRMRTEDVLKEKEAYLQAILDTIQTGVLITDPRTCRIKDANPFTAEMIGIPSDALIGQELHDYLHCDEDDHCPLPGFWHEKTIDGHLHSSRGDKIYVRMCSTPVRLNQYPYFLHSLSDLTDIRNLLKKQEINIGLAKSILQLINGIPPRYMDLHDERLLFLETLSIPCNAEGGDHFLVWASHATTGENAKTCISLKDQSGHEVGCILRSIITDLMHNSILQNDQHRSLESRMIKLNNEICHSGFFRDEDFFTAMNLNIDHQSLELKYVSAGHPPFLLIRDRQVMSFPETNRDGMNLPMAMLPDVTYTSGRFQLQEGDKLLVYTDGLIEMPLKNQGSTLPVKSLKQMVRQWIEDQPDIPVSDMLHKIVNRIAQQSHETVIPADGQASHINTSADDITMICMEIENKTRYTEKILTPVHAEELCQSIRVLYQAISEEWQQRKFEALSRLRMVIEEALLNAWKHGNHQNPHKTITVRWRFGNDFHLDVIDEGHGFDPSQLPDPRADANLDRENGRGIFIIRHFADSVNWMDNGRQLHVMFKKYQTLKRNHRHQTRPLQLMALWNQSRTCS
jgi:PAS domain S-box-containing protein